MPPCRGTPRSSVPCRHDLGTARAGASAAGRNPARVARTSGRGRSAAPAHRLDSVIRLLRWIRRHAGLVAELAAYGFWLMIDLAVSVFAGPFGTLVAAVVVPLRRRPGARLVPTAAVAIALSLAISLLCAAQHALFPGVPEATSDLAFT